MRFCRSRGLPGSLARSFELSQPGSSRRVRFRLDCAVLLDQPRAKRRQGGTAAVGAARLRSNDGLAEAIVHVVDEEPRAPIRHPERDAGLGNRSGVAYRLEQPDLARAHRPVVAEIDAQCQSRRRHVGGPRPVSSKPYLTPKRRRSSNLAASRDPASALSCKMLGETDPFFAGNRIIVAYASGGQPLGSAGIARIVAPGDKAGGRFVPNIAKIEVRDTPPRY
jgi:hypothetical protein